MWENCYFCDVLHLAWIAGHCFKFLHEAWALVAIACLGCSGLIINAWRSGSDSSMMKAVNTGQEIHWMVISMWTPALCIHNVVLPQTVPTQLYWMCLCAAALQSPFTGAKEQKKKKKSTKRAQFTPDLFTRRQRSCSSGWKRTNPHDRWVELIITAMQRTHTRVMLRCSRTFGLIAESRSASLALC